MTMRVPFCVTTVGMIEAFGKGLSYNATLSTTVAPTRPLDGGVGLLHLATTVEM